MIKKSTFKNKTKHRPLKIFLASLSMLIIFFTLIELILRLITIYISPEKKILLSLDPIATDPCPRKAVYRTVVDKDLFWINPATINEDFKLIPPDTTRIICMGDSTTAGYHMLPKGCSFPEQLDMLLTNSCNSKIDVINAGVGGYSSYQGLIFLKKHILNYKPSIITIKFGCNDAASAFPLPDKDISIKKEHMIISKALNHSRIYQLIWFLKTVKINKYYSQHSSELPQRVNCKDYRENINEIVTIAKNNGIKIILITNPTRNPDLLVQRYNKILRDIAKSQNVLLINADLIFKDLGEKSKDLFYDSGHLKAEGEEIIAAKLNDVILKFLIY